MVSNTIHSLTVGASSLWFASLGWDIGPSWLRCLFFSESLVQLLLAASGLLQPDRSDFSYLIHHLPHITEPAIVLAATNLSLFRLFAAFDVPYSPWLILLAPVLALSQRFFHMKHMFTIVIAANLVWAVAARSPAVLLYSVNCIACFTLDVPWIGEILNLLVWYLIKQELA
ncbi:hypothetical protein HKX48_004682 [Thoreauomyces humboldtii]|nr:hypothetical protein HKX48_004682 [Thoreauomyces humboldtii]